jgi:hypothetical protein
MASPFLQHAVDRLFARMTAIYGREFSGKFDGTTPEAVKAAWAHELRFFERQLDSVAWAIEHLPEKCPNAVQFRNLCNNAPVNNAVAMLPDQSPVRGPTAAEREVLRSLSADIKANSIFARPGRDWARGLIARNESGTHSATPVALAMARDALGTPVFTEESPS